MNGIALQRAWFRPLFAAPALFCVVGDEFFLKVFERLFAEDALGAQAAFVIGRVGA